MRNYSMMARELVWLEDFAFTAWGCKECNWIIPNPGYTHSDKAPAKVQEAFEKHECATFPRTLMHKRKAEQD